MAGLVTYESSDEEEEVKPQPAPEPLRKIEAVTADADSTLSTTTVKPKSPQQKAGADEGSTVYGPQIGPSLGPSFPPLEEDPASADLSLPSRPGSPYTATRALLRDLTLPAVPDMDIPPSPPGSPSASTTRKFETFLELKKKGTHFNARMAETASMKNPALADKLLAFAELDHRDQYRTTFAEKAAADFNCGNPDVFPRFVYKEQLRQSQSEIAQRQTRGIGDPVRFVAAGEDGRMGKRKTRFDT
ncbi:HCNGP-like protein-domain-containing protein [Nemania sp. FL0031]|nr:HCNGP-like protein-domain-containing protein [Nemania sp. FL0031]